MTSAPSAPVESEVPSIREEPSLENEMLPPLAAGRTTPFDRRFSEFVPERESSDHMTDSPQDLLLLDLDNDGFDDDITVDDLLEFKKQETDFDEDDTTIFTSEVKTLKVSSASAFRFFSNTYRINQDTQIMSRLNLLHHHNIMHCSFTLVLRELE